MRTVHPSSLAKLIRSLAVLALPAEDQVTWLKSLGLGEPWYAYELAMELDDALLLCNQFVKAEWLSPDVVKIMTDIGEVFAQYVEPGNDDFWNLDGLASSPDWVRIRKLALEALCVV